MVAVNKLWRSAKKKYIEEEINKEIALKQRIDKLGATILSQDEIIKSIMKSNDKHEQFIHKNNIFIYSLKENDNEDCKADIINMFNNK